MTSYASTTTGAKFPSAHSQARSGRPRALFFLGAILALGLNLPARAQETIGGGTVSSPAVGPAPSYGIGGPNMVLVKNWHFGADGTIRNYADMSANFYYHDQFGTIGNGSNYGAVTVSPDAANALNGQPIEGVNSPSVRQFTTDSLKTFLTPLNGATTCDPNLHNAGNGSFMAKWQLPNGGSLLGQDIVWETRVRYVTPPYFWFALWTAGNQWKWDGAAQGAEQDLVESFGYDNGGGFTNFDGRFWHSNSVANPSKDTVDYSNWGNAMAAQGIPSYDATQYHTWTWLYRKDNTFAMYVDGILVQHGSNYYWTYGNTASDPPINMDFLFDAGWGHTQVGSVDHPLPATAFTNTYYEFNYSRVYLSGGTPEGPYNGPHNIPGATQAVDYDTGGQGLAYNQTANGSQSGFRPDNSSADYGSGIGWTGAGQWYRYTVNVGTAGPYKVAFSVASPSGGGTFHLEDERGTNLTGSVTAPNTGSWNTPGTVTASVIPTLTAGTHVLKWVQDGGGYNLLSMTFTVATPTSSATFAKLDTTTHGNWKGVYGADGFTLVNDSSANNPKAPSYGSASTGAWGYTWNGSTTDTRALQKAAGGSTDRIAAQWGGDPTFDIDCNLTGSGKHQVALYALDWDYGSRNETVQVLDAGTGTVLDSQTLTSFTSGTYLVWTVQGHVRFHVVKNGGSNLAISGIFFGPAAGTGALITGTVFSDGAGPWGGNTANSAPAAFDGSTSTFYDCANSTGYVGIDVGLATPVSKIVFAPRTIWEARMVGGVFEGSNTSATTGYTTLGTVTSTPLDGLVNTLTVPGSPAYRWLRYRDSQGGNVNVAEIQFLN